MNLGVRQICHYRTGGDVIIENVRIGPVSGLSNLYWNLKFISSATTLTAADAGAKAMLDSANGCALTLPDCTVSTIGFHVEVFVKTASTSNGYTIAAAGSSSDVFQGTLVLSTGNAIAMVSNANTVYLKAEMVLNQEQLAPVLILYAENPMHTMFVVSF